MRKLSLALSVLVLPFAGYSVQAQAVVAKTGTATVSGRVVLKGEPVRGVMVILALQGRNFSDAPRARTDESGRFNFTGVPAGRYSVFASVPGYMTPSDSGWGTPGKTLNVVDGEKVENIDIEIKRGGVIAGRITDSQGRPVIEERVTLSRLDANNRSQGSISISYGQNYDMYQTNDRGYYRIYGLPEARYVVSVGHAEHSGSGQITSRREFYPRVFYPNAASESEAKVINISEGSVAEDIDITVSDPKPTHDVSGRVVEDGSGQPVAGVEVAIGWVTKEGIPTGAFAGSARSGPNGDFLIYGVVPGKYALIVPQEESAGFIGDPVAFDITEGDATGLELRMRKGASISGSAVIEGTNDPKVLSKLSQVSLFTYIQPAGPNAPRVPMARRPIKVNVDGGFRIQGLHAGKARIMISPPPEMRGLMLGRVEQNGTPAPEGIDVGPGEQVTGVRLVLIYGSLTLRGEVKIVGDAVPAGQKFYAQASRLDQTMQNEQSGEVDARGQFLIENLTPGEYEIMVLPIYRRDNQLLSPEIIRRVTSIKERVVLSGANQQPITFVIDLSRKENDK